MKTVQMRHVIGPDGRLRVDVPAGASGQTVDVLVVITPASAEASDQARPDAEADQAWADVVNRAFGSCVDLEEPDDPPPAPVNLGDVR